MRKSLKKITLLSVAASSMLYAGGYKIPTTSLNGVALSAASVAHSISSDAAYYNPANMAFMDDKNSIEVDATYLSLTATNFKGSGTMAGIDIDAQSETAVLPSLHYVSADMSGYRFGFSLVVPGGSTKRWNVAPAVYSAEEFGLQIIELNPTVAKKITDDISLALGVRALYSSGVVKSTYPASASRDLRGESFDYGYNAALSYKPSNELEMAITYRSNVELSEEGNAKLYVGDAKVYDGGANVTVPLPASVNLALAYTLESKTTIEFVYERNFWSAYEYLDFDYSDTLPLVLQGSAMEIPIPKKWKDVNAYRIGITQQLDELTLMGGFVYDETPVPDETLSFELPGANSMAFSAGCRYELSSELNAGLAGLYSIKEARSVSNSNMSGEFTNSNALLVSAGVEYKF